MDEEINIKVDDAIPRRYTLRQVGPDGKYYSVQVPKEVVEREARRHGLTEEQFSEKFELEALYNSFQGIHYRFVPKKVQLLITPE